MLKKIQFKLIKIKYTGKSIGNDIRIDIELLDQVLRVDKRMRARKTAELNQSIGTFPSDQKTFSANVKITVTEKDILFNDIGKTEKTIKVDTGDIKPQNFTYNIELRENRFGKTWGKSIAIFEVTIEALVINTIKYTPDIDNGWLKVKIVDGDAVSLPAFLKIQSDYIEGGREYFTILEGIYRGQKGSVSLDENKESRFLSKIEHEPLIHLQYSISQKALIIDNKKYQTTDYTGSPWKKGWHDIELPDYPHKDPSSYVNISSRFKTWFR
ncbi:TPA: hypothetical protein DCZ15_01490, partial [Candidatus Falkowbacteria bacterium]|nr:hypothetical protein [Candidatus Falkowbacteria bacterium]